MEQHPVPQNVTTFQFRLIGDMTIRQFGYLAGGIIVGYICYKLPLPFFFSWPLAISSGFLGFGLAFVPVEERPMDIWIASFFKNVYSPTQWVWSREARSGSAGQKSPPLAPARPPQKTPAPEKYVAAGTHTTGTIISMNYSSHLFDWLKSIFSAKPKPVSPSLSPGFSFADALTKHAEPSKKPQASAPPPPPPPPQPVATAAPSPTHGRVVELQTQLSDALAQRERMEKELIAIRLTLNNQAKNASQAPMRQASVMPPPSGAPSTSVRVIAPEAAAKAGLPRLTTFPNVVTGIIKDPYGNLLAGMLITVRDKDDVPLRALKTNKLGQFAASTPLPDNTYIVEIEDPKGAFIFNKVQIPLIGTVAPPIEVTAKSQKQVERDKLAREIFGQNQI